MYQHISLLAKKKKGASPHRFWSRPMTRNQRLFFFWPDILTNNIPDFSSTKRRNCLLNAKRHPIPTRMNSTPMPNSKSHPIPTRMRYTTMLNTKRRKNTQTASTKTSTQATDYKSQQRHSQFIKTSKLWVVLSRCGRLFASELTQETTRSTCMTAVQRQRPCKKIYIGNRLYLTYM